MKRRTIELCKTVVILLLLLSLTWLALTAVSYSGAGTAFASRLTSGLGGASEIPPRKEENPSLSDAASPLLISVHTDAGRASFWGSSPETGAVYETLGSLLAEALDTAGALFPIDAAAFCEAAAGDSVYFRFPGEVPLPVLAAWLDAVATADVSADRFLLEAKDGAVRLLAGGETGYYVMDTQTASEALLHALRDYPNDGTRLAMEMDHAVFRRIGPMTLVDPSVTSLTAGAAENACDEAFLSAAATLLGFNPYGDASYRDTAGNLVFTEADCVLRVAGDGVMTFRNQTLAPRFSAGGSDDGACIEYVRGLLERMTGGRLKDASLQFSGLRHEDGQTVITFSYILAGLPVEQSGGPAVEAQFTGAVLSSLRFQVRAYTLSQTEEVPLLPPAQAAAVLEQGAELRPAYADQGDGPLAAGWLR